MNDERSMPERDGPDRRFRLLREEIGALLREVPGGCRSLHARIGDCAVEITWPDRAEVAGGSGADAAEAGPSRAAASRAEPLADGATVVVRAPIVGTFFRAPEPGAPPFVEVGDRVMAGQIVAIIEAMKLMNSIEVPRSGIVVEILVDNAEGVEFDQPLMRIKPEHP